MSCTISHTLQQAFHAGPGCFAVLVGGLSNPIEPDKAEFGPNKEVLRAFTKLTSTLGLQAHLSPLGLLLRWLAHFVLHCTDEAQVGRNSCLQLHSWHHLEGSCSAFALGVDANARPILNLKLVQTTDWSLNNIIDTTV